MYLVSATELIQLAKLPSLIEHYVEHKNLNNKLTFLDFYAMHYANMDINDNDDQKDMKLPFKSQKDCSHSNITALSPNNFPINILTFTAICLNKGYDKQFLISSYLSNIWQPPKIC